MEEVLRIWKYTLYAYAIGGYCVYVDGESKRVFYSKTMWESVKYIEDEISKI